MQSELLKTGYQWSISFSDPMPPYDVYIRLGTNRRKEAEQLYGWWLSELGEGVTLSAPCPVMGISVARVIADFVLAPLTPKGHFQKHELEIAKRIGQYFGQMALQEIEPRHCIAYAERRRADLVGGDPPDEWLVGAHLTIRREINYLLAAALHARKWRRIRWIEFPDIQTCISPSKLTREELLGPIRLDRRRRLPEQSPMAFVRAQLARRRLLQVKGRPRPSPEDLQKPKI
ncbi:hypothetical protein AB4Z40_13085 [Bosea sp. 2YAB26]|uniref:hypothetical protein n=1 Tax=Bosea sp. 2YAB26 TaxID=3237478 RepID=UPI003F8E5DDC